MDIWEYCITISLQHVQYPQLVGYMVSYSLYHSTRNPHRAISLTNGKNVVGRSSACHITYPDSLSYMFLSHHVSSVQPAASCCSHSSGTKPTVLDRFSSNGGLQSDWDVEFGLLLKHRIMSTGMTPIFVKSPHVDKEFRALKRGERSNVYVSTMICL